MKKTFKKILHKAIFYSTLLGISCVIYILSGSAQIDPSFDSGLSIGFLGEARSVIIQEDGKMIIGGEFTSYKGVNKNNIIRLNADETIDTTFDIGSGFNGGVYDIKQQSDGKIIVVGYFTSFNGNRANKVVRLNIDGSIDNSFINGLNASYNEINNSYNEWQLVNIQIQNDGKILLGGRNYLGKGIVIRLNSDGSIDNSFDIGIGFNNDVKTLALQADGKILVGGEFTSYQGIGATRIARLNSDGSIDNSFISNGFNNTVSSIKTQNDGKILVGGAFGQGIKRLHTDGSIDTSFSASGINGGEVMSIEILDNGGIVLGGRFDFYQSIRVNNIVGINSDGSRNYNLDIGNGVNNTIYDIEKRNNGEIIIVGSFKEYKSTVVNNIAIIDNNGTLLNNILRNTHGFNGNVRFIVANSVGKAIVAGDFSQYKGTHIGNIVKLNGDGSIDTSFVVGSGFSSDFGTPHIDSMILQNDGKVLVAGFFHTYQGTAVKPVVRLNTDGSVDNSFDVGNTFDTIQIYSIKQQSDGKLLLAGGNNLIRVNTDGSVDTSFGIGSGFNGNIMTISIETNGKILVGGDFSTYQGSSAKKIIRLNADGSRDNTFDIGGDLNQRIENISIQNDGKVLIAGIFDRFTENGTTTGTCSDGRTNIDQSSCLIGSCSDGRTNIDQSSCTSSRYCSDPSYTDQTSCESAGYCSDPSYTDQISCESTYYCTDSNYTDETSCLEAGYCSHEGYDKVSCESTYFCSDPSYTDETSCLENGNTGERGYWNTLGYSWSPQQWTFSETWKQNSWTSYNNTWIPGKSTGKLIRLSANGTIDGSFNSLGNLNYIQNIAVQSDGKVLVVGDKFIRLNSDGSIDTSFDLGTNFNGYSYSINQLDNGKILVGGNFSNINGNPIGHLAAFYGDSEKVILPNSSDTMLVNNEFTSKGYIEDNGVLVGSTPISLIETNGEIPTNLNLENENISISLEANTQLKKADSNINYNEIISLPVVTDIKSVNNEPVIKAFTIGAVSETITLDGGFVMITTPVDSYIGDIVNIYYSNDNGVSWYFEQTGIVIEHNRTPSIQFTTNHLNSFAITKTPDIRNPIGTISYNTTGTTTNNVIATLTLNETGIITNNSGSHTYTFTTNGSFTFTFEDRAGNTGEATAIVNRITTPSPIITGDNTQTNTNGGGGSSSSSSSSNYYSPVINTPIITDPIENNILVHNAANGYSDEYTNAYLWAYQNGITTMSTIEKANLEGKVYRSHLAKMISTYATKILHKKPDIQKNCSFTDLYGQSKEMKIYITAACELGLMGLNSNGTPNQKFNPKEEVSRAQFGTILSRLLYGNTYNTEKEDGRYVNHLKALQTNRIMNNISNPFMNEIRGNVFLMLMRSVN